MQALQKLVQKIDKEGYYPKEQIIDFAKRGYFGVLQERSDIFKAIEKIGEV